MGCFVMLNISRHKYATNKPAIDLYRNTFTPRILLRFYVELRSLFEVTPSFIWGTFKPQIISMETKDKRMHFTFDFNMISASYLAS